MHPRIRTAVRSARAFTLVELLVVLVVLGVAAGLLVANLEGGEQRHAERESKRLAASLEHAASRAQWTGETLGFSADGGAYRFWRRNTDDRWSPVRDDDVLAPRTLPAGLTVVAATFAGAAVPADAVLPFRSTGRNEPFTLLLRGASDSYTIAADPLNRVRVLSSSPSAGAIAR